MRAKKEMTVERRANLVEEFIKKYCKGVMSTKGSSYSRGEANVNSNFYRNAEGLGTTPMTPAWLFALKHVDAVTDYVKRGCEGTEIGGESVESRLGDIINYCFILYSILVQEGVLKDSNTEEYSEILPDGDYPGLKPEDFPAGPVYGPANPNNPFNRDKFNAP